ncbi:Fibrinogen-like protein A,Ryncolin-4,Fibrinogen C domain-containing protein 1-A,Ficolin-1-A,Ficolin-2,Ficolin-1,Fibrinogen C domain-containing protein 1-B,Fibrinogen C domain-containing protein 1 [Mytilus coruscus]|uniref:Fibrinogen-like protein A,Ryncolin-4,Fibrinogen C domain-containing protein 1-A,Ficolin-1-A,Ficolin-2,Ficolin-1,Fibrinogen C domain-containing protein 1-B,Fibrinogen C domain-containing protein 1 n=1 Tax=Mytilus coruscus TaxID=42192 RepID=A0A6J8E3R4_MYTCO|nr:Fibrinogen-like protein A,Ryncolin-4,Fibrinogen C domain-containing protein 1-A,Ficolin-1-A,Ficolin-2,Ficolin-1,Fibrinogen C domain-containing protein 1-B,Fibrinogen C domain-containing protein 1 [Mytilus coruscus]
MSKHDLSQWVLDWLWTHPRGNGEFCFLVGEWSVCVIAFLTVIGMPLSTYYTLRKRYKLGEKVIGRQGKRKDQQMSATQTATIWLHDYANKFAEKQPDKTRLHLPPCLTKASLYEMYKDDMEEHAEQTISLSHFYWMWRNCVSYVSIPANSRLSKCNICTQIKTKMVETKDQNARMELKRTREQHLLKQSLERRKYYKHAHKARQHPDKYMSIIIDGMDQSKTEIPNFLYLSSLTAGMWKLTTHLVGALVHGDFINPISGHSQPHTFKFVLGDDGKSNFLYKKWANDKVWLECNGSEKNILKAIPNTCLSFMPMNDDQIDVDRLKADINKVNKQYGCDKDGWWTSFFTDIVTAIPNQEIHPQSTWPLEEIVMAKENQRNEENMIVEPPSNQCTVHIDGFSDEDSVPLIILGKKERERKQKEKEVEDVDEVPAKGNFVLTNIAKYAREWPQLGKVSKLEDGLVHIHWYKGSKTGPWAPCTKPVSGSRRKREAWCEAVDMKDIWCHVTGYTDCSDVQHKFSGMYRIFPVGIPEGLLVYCDMETDGGHWTVIQRRIDESVDFYRTWLDYSKGFGSLIAEFYLGNRYIHALTHQAECELRVDLRNSLNYSSSASYSSFAISYNATRYSLNVNGFNTNSNAGDSLTDVNLNKFRTFDVSDDSICPSAQRGAWWYGYCSLGNLNIK